MGSSFLWVMVEELSVLGSELSVVMGLLRLATCDSLLTPWV